MKTHETLAQQEFVAKQLRRRQMVVLARLFLFLSVLVLWEACARTGVINAFIFSSPSRIVLLRRIPLRALFCFLENPGC